MKKIIVFVFSLSFVSCSTALKSSVYSGIIGSTICGVTGYALGKKTSPNIQSEKTNQLIGGLGGAVACGLIGAYLGNKFYKDDPENFKGEEIIIPERRSIKSKQRKLKQDISLKDLGL
jgi:hypothetical protein